MSNRFVKKWTRTYYQGYDISGYTRSWGQAGEEYALVGEDEPMLDEAVKGVMLGQATPMVGPISSVMDNTASGMHATFSGQSSGVLTVAIGFDGAPAAGDPVYAGEFEQLSYMGDVGEDVPVTLTFAQTVNATTLLYDRHWGRLLHASGAETGANSSTSDYDHGAQTTYGGFMVYHMLSSDGTAAIKVQDADTDLDGSFSDLLTSGDVDASASPQSGLVALARDATVERYVRWQLALNTATTVTFVLSFHRALR